MEEIVVNLLDNALKYLSPGRPGSVDITGTRNGVAITGIEPAGDVVPRLSLSYATAFHRCEACSYKHACREWLDRMLRSVTFAPRFCPKA